MYDHDTAYAQPQVVALELRNMKMNNGAQPPPQFVTFSFQIDGTIDVTTGQPAGHKPKDLAFSVLYRAKRPLTTKAIVAAIKAESGDSISEETMRKALQRDTSRVSKTDDVPSLWTISKNSGTAR
jgi:protein-disulfide isomerase-like protein with CxxC motif